MVRAWLNEHFQRTGPPSGADQSPCLMEKPVGPSEFRTRYTSAPSRTRPESAVAQHWLDSRSEISNQRYKRLIMTKFLNIICITTDMNVVFPWSCFSILALSLTRFEKLEVVNIFGKNMACAVIVKTCLFPVVASFKLIVFGALVRTNRFSMRRNLIWL